MSGPSEDLAVESRSVAIINVHGIGTPERRLDEGEEQAWVSIGQFEHFGRAPVQIAFPKGTRRSLISIQ